MEIFQCHVSFQRAVWLAKQAPFTVHLSFPPKNARLRSLGPQAPLGEPPWHGSMGSGGGKSGRKSLRSWFLWAPQLKPKSCWFQVPSLKLTVCTSQEAFTKGNYLRNPSDSGARVSFRDCKFRSQFWETFWSLFFFWLAYASLWSCLKNRRSSTNMNNSRSAIWVNCWGTSGGG